MPKPSDLMKQQFVGRAIEQRYPEFFIRQDILYKYFDFKLFGNRNMALEALKRTGPIMWDNPRIAKGLKRLIKSWRKGAFDGPGALKMNCWETVLYAAYHASVADRKKCHEICTFLGNFKGNLEGLYTYFGRPRGVGTRRMGDILIWTNGNDIAHVAIHLGNAPVAGNLLQANGNSEFIWQNSGLTSWNIDITQGFTHIAPFHVVDLKTKGNPACYSLL